ncbi:FtsX-like permease family protein [Lachnospiraceae bacterium NK3A20]|nr:FtsX-like permease family protein [Lachnospiraceae bacterium NK3A20]
MMRGVFSSLWRHRWRTLLILLLIYITSYLTLTALTNRFAFQTQIRSVQAMFSCPLDQIYRIDMSYIDHPEEAGTAIHELKEFINAQDGAYCGAYDEVGELFTELQKNRDYLALNEESYAGSLREDTPSISEVMFVDAPMLRFVATGLSEEDFHAVTAGEDTYLPLYVGKDFANVLAVGDKLTQTRTGARYIVQGILPDMSWFDDSDPVTMPLTSLNHKFLAPFSEADQTDSMTQQSTAGKIFYMSSEDIKARVSDKALQLGIKVRVTRLSDYIGSWQQDNYRILRANDFLAAVVLFCSAISIISTLCVAVLLKRKEYGIRIAFGTSKREIILTLCLEMLTVSAMGGIIAYAVRYRGYADDVISSFRVIYTETLRSVSLPGLIIMLLTLCAVVLIVPVTILRRFYPAELIREERD